MIGASRWVAAAAGLEILTGAGLMVAPSLLATLLFGSEMNASGNAAGRIAGLVMVCLAIASWPRGPDDGSSQALLPLLALSVLAALYLAVVGLIGATVGALLWPAAAIHLVIAVLLVRAWMAGRRAAG